MSAQGYRITTVKERTDRLGDARWRERNTRFLPLQDVVIRLPSRPFANSPQKRSFTLRAECCGAKRMQKM